MEADLQRYYGIDYLDRWRGGLSLRKIRSLIIGLPGESDVKVRQTGGTSEFGLVHALLDDIGLLLRALGGQKRPDPHPLRPRARPKQRSAQQVAAFRRRAARARAKAASRQT